MKALRWFPILVPLAACALLLIPRPRERLRVGSKKFTESVILGEMLTQLVGTTGSRCLHRAELGGTRVLWNALRQGDIDMYPEYTGTLAMEILADQGLETEADIRAALERLGLRMSRPIGFNNSYALGMLQDRADELGVARISDLRAHADLRLGFTNEFMDRGDGWPSLRAHYRLPHSDVRGLDHDLAYQALAQGSIDVADLYTTDAKLRTLDLAVLEDDRRHFRRYEAVILYRAELERSVPGAVAAVTRLERAIDEAMMVDLNARVEMKRVPEAAVSARFLREQLGVDVEVDVEAPTKAILRRTREHLRLVLVSMVAAVMVSVPLGVWAAKRPAQGQAILAVVGIIQTIPSLALLVLLMKPLSLLANAVEPLERLGISGVGNAPAIVALFLYSLLPMVRNTAAGLSQIPRELDESARALGLPDMARLRLIELPMAGPTILAGIKTAAVANIGFATLGALIGAGGYGQPILTGIRLNDYGLILCGAVPAAVLAILAQVWFELVERLWVPRGLRLKAAE